jgi:hypothetical protein
MGSLFCVGGGTSRSSSLTTGRAFTVGLGSAPVRTEGGGESEFMYINRLAQPFAKTLFKQVKEFIIQPRT